MMVVPLEAIPNQRVDVVLSGSAYSVEILTRRGRLYITVWQDAAIILSNRYLAAYAPLVKGFVLADTEGTDDPVYEGLGARWQLLFAEAADIA